MACASAKPLLRRRGIYFSAPTIARSSRVSWRTCRKTPRLLQVFEKGEDIHMATAMEIFKPPSEQVTKAMRRAAKSVVFGIVYGISPFGLASNIGVSQADAKKYIETFFEKFAAVQPLMDRNIEDGKTKGYTTTILGRRRPIPELQSGDPSQRGVGERMAVNSPIQGSAADLIKVAMINVHRRLPASSRHCKMILQVHDELIFEVPDEELEQAKQLVKQEMEATGTALGSLGAAQGGSGRRKKLAGGPSVRSATRRIMSVTFADGRETVSAQCLESR